MTLIDLSLYWPVYKTVLIFTIASACVYLFLFADFKQRVPIIINVIMLFYTLFTVVLMGYRPPSARLFGDSANYHLIFLEIQNGREIGGGDVLFNGLMYLFAQISPYGDTRTFFLVVMSLYVGTMIWALRRWFTKDWAIAMAFMVFSGFFISYGVNGIRNGLATSLFLLGLSFKSTSRYLLYVMAFFTHSSLLLPIAAALLFKYFKNINWYFSGWIVCFLISLAVPGLGVFLADLGIFSDKLADYVNSDNKEAVWGFRVDYILYALLPILIGAFYVYKLKFLDSVYLEILAIYITANAFWLLVIRVPFSNRFAYLSWFMYGLVIVYPLLKSSYFKYENRYASALLTVVFTFNLLFLF